MQNYILRDSYLDFLKKWKQKDVIKVISGVRRAGKSRLLTMFQEELLREGVLAEHMITINLESREYRRVVEADALEEIIYSKLKAGGYHYVFLDEIQRVKGFESVVDALFVEENVDVYITGSNAYFLSSELGTFLSGRYIELVVYPLSFAEYVHHIRKEVPEKQYFTLPMLYSSYLLSSFPFTATMTDREDINTYLEGIYSTVLIRDVVKRNNITEVANLERIVQFLYSVIGSTISVNKIKNTLASNGLSLASTTIDKYLDALTSSMLFYSVPRYSIRGKRLLSREEKIYPVDLGIRNIVLPDANEDAGHILEAIVFLELKRRKQKVYIGKFDDYEIDFVTMDHDKELEFYQVSLSTIDPNTLERELRPLRRLGNSYPKYLLTLDEVDTNTNYDGIKKLNALYWLNGLAP